MCREEAACGKGLRSEFKVTQLGQQMVGWTVQVNYRGCLDS